MRIKINSIFKTLSYIVLIELILGGSGKVISFGPISLRMILLGLILACEFLLIFSGNLYLTKNNGLLLGIITIFLLNSIISATKNDIGDVLDVLLGYMTILICPFYIWLCNRNENIHKVWLRIFMICSLILSIISILFWFYAFVRGKSIYYTFMVPLNNSAYSRMGFIGNIPRVFLKGSIFTCIGTVFSVYLLANNKGKHGGALVFATVIFMLATVFTFTLGFYFAAILGLLLVLRQSLRWNSGKVFLIVLITTPIVVYLANKFDLIYILLGKFENGYTASARFTQVHEVAKEILHFPELFIGNGFGTRFYIDYGYTIVNHYNLEIMWLQLLADTGIIGFFVYVSYIISVINRMGNIYRAQQNDDIYLFRIGLIMICFISFINPYMNNTIGIEFFAFCVGLSSVDSTRIQKEVKEEQYPNLETV